MRYLLIDSLGKFAFRATEASTLARFLPRSIDDRDNLHHLSHSQSLVSVPLMLLRPQVGFSRESSYVDNVPQAS